MAVPADIRAVERPRNTFVVDSKTGVYPVREKVGCGYYVDESGKAHRPSKNGKVIGHIVNMTYVPKEEPPIPEVGCVDLKDYGNVRLCELLSGDIYSKLQRHYNEDDAERLYTMAILRACYDGIKDYMLERQYEETFLSETHPGVDLRRDPVSKFLRKVGRSGSRIVAFMEDSVAECQSDDDIIVFDGTLKRDESTVNSLSAASRKTAAQRYRHVNVMTAYSVKKKEQIASRIYPGNMVDQKIVVDFVDILKIERGLIVADRGFPPEAIRAALIGRPGIGYMVPLKRDRSEIKELSLRDYDTVLPGTSVACKKAKGTDEHGDDVWYYSFRDPLIASDEESAYLRGRAGQHFDHEDLERMQRQFGTMVLASNRDMELAEARSTYAKRWIIESSFKFERSELGDDTTDEESDYTVQASQFVDHLSSVMAMRMRNAFEGRGLLKDRTYGEVYSLLLRLKMTRESDGEEWKLRRIADRDEEVSIVLGLIVKPIVPEIPKKRGRPAGSKDKKPRQKRGSSKGTGRGLKNPDKNLS